MKVKQTNRFEKAYKKLHANQRAEVNKAIKAILANPLIGTLNKGDLKDVRIYKFKMLQQLTLLAYSYEEQILVLTFIAVGSHENFYRDISHS